MKNIILLSVLVFVCSCGKNHVREHYVEVREGYECRDKMEKIIRLCDTKEECNNFCEQANNKKE